MSLATTTDRVTFAGNGVTTAFAFPYNFSAEADLVVISKLDSTAVETTKTLTTHYTTVGAGVDGGGTITYLVAPPTGTTVIIYRDRSPKQEVDIGDNGKISSASLEEQLDRLTMMIQRIRNVQARSLRLPEGFTATFDGKLPGLMIADGFLKATAAGTGVEWSTGSAPSNKLILGTRAAPIEIVGAAGIPFTSTSWETTMFIAGSGGAVICTAAARIQAGTFPGQTLKLIGRGNSVTIPDGQGVSTGGQDILHVADSTSVWNFDGTNWVIETTNGLM